MKHWFNFLWQAICDGRARQRRDFADLWENVSCPECRAVLAAWLTEAEEEEDLAELRESWAYLDKHVLGRPELELPTRATGGGGT